MLLVLLAGCGGDGYREFAGPTMGTSYRVVARCVPGLEREPVTHVLARVNAAMSNWDRDSEISRFHRVPPGAWVSLSPALAMVIRAGLELSEASDGAFDLTVGALVDAWGFGPRANGQSGQRTADDGEIDAARRRVGHRFLEIDGERLRRTAPVRVDLAAIAKGYGVDALAGELDARGCTDYLAEIGGELRVRGESPAGRPWRVAIESPEGGDSPPVRVLQLRRGAVATSGDYRNFAVRDGARYGHIIDPATGVPVRHGLASVSVLHDSAMWADGYATLIHVLGPQRGLAFADTHGLAVHLVLRGGDGLETRGSAAMDAILAR